MLTFVSYILLWSVIISLGKPAFCVAILSISYENEKASLLVILIQKQLGDHTDFCFGIAEDTDSFNEVSQTLAGIISLTRYQIFDCNVGILGYLNTGMVSGREQKLVYVNTFYMYMFHMLTYCAIPVLPILHGCHQLRDTEHRHRLDAAFH